MWDLISAVPCLSLKFPLVYVSNLALAVLSSSASRMVPRSANYLPMNNPGGTTCVCSHEAPYFPLRERQLYLIWTCRRATFGVAIRREAKGKGKFFKINKHCKVRSRAKFLCVCPYLHLKMCILAGRFFLDRFQKAESPWNWTVDIKSWQDLIYFCKYSISLETPPSTSHPNQS